MRKFIRRYLGIDTWGMDLYRIKRRLGEIMQDDKQQQALNSAIVSQFGIHLEALQQQDARIKKLEDLLFADSTSTGAN